MTMKIYKPNDKIEIESIMCRGILDMTASNTRNCPYLYKDRELKEYFDHTKARNGSRFYDGNNGDLWRIIWTNKEDRMLVQNLWQEFLSIIIF